LRNRPFRRARGFTLIEIIITLVVLGIAAAMVAVFFGPGVTRSSDPIFALQKDADLQAVMENMIQDQGDNYSADKTALGNFSTKVGTVGSDRDNDYGQYHVDRNSLCYLPTGSRPLPTSGEWHLSLLTYRIPASRLKDFYLFTTQ
jgi:prepilin-type N-terminal cleavage/methylation domain-containing protein